MIKRKIDSYLEQYFSSSKTALLITGARQIGKSYSVRQFGQTHYESYIELNFISNPEYARLFETPLGADEILLRISAVADKPLIKGKTLIFFDEVTAADRTDTADYNDQQDLIGHGRRKALGLDRGLVHGQHCSADTGEEG